MRSYGGSVECHQGPEAGEPGTGRIDFPGPSDEGDKESMTPETRRVKEMDDRALVAAILAGESALFDEIFDRFHGRVFGFALRRVRRADEAEDIAQEVFLQIFRSLPSYQGRASLSTWIFGIAHNVTCRHFRRRSAPVVSIEQCDAPEFGSTVPAEERRIDAVRAVERCAQTLAHSRAPEHLEIFRQFYGGGRSLRVIARSTCKPTESVKDSLRRTRNLLRRNVSVRL